MKLLGSADNKTAKDKRCENMPHLEITEMVLVHCNIAKNNYQHRVSCIQQESCIHMFQIDYLVNYEIFHRKNLYF